MLSVVSFFYAPISSFYTVFLYDSSDSNSQDSYILDMCSRITVFLFFVLLSTSFLKYFEVIIMDLEIHGIPDLEISLDL